MTEKLYPQRTRCKQCRKGLKAPVIRGIFCSYQCAKVNPPVTNLDVTPRHCKRQINGIWGNKTRYDAPSFVPKKYQDDPSTNIYLCDNCNQYHIGHSRVETVQREQLTRYVKTYAELGSVIERYMETHKYTKKQVANALKVPQKRVTEVWEGSPKVTATFLFNLLGYIKLRIELSSPPSK